MDFLISTGTALSGFQVSEHTIRLATGTVCLAYAVAGLVAVSCGDRSRVFPALVAFVIGIAFVFF